MGADPISEPSAQAGDTGLDSSPRGVAVALVIVVATFPVVVPYLVVSNPNLAVRLSHLIAVAVLFLLGAWWGRVVGGGAIRIATGLTLLGLTLVLITIALGG